MQVEAPYRGPQFRANRRSSERDDREIAI